MKNAVFLIWFLSISLLNVNVSWAQHAGDDSHNGPTDQVRRMKSWEHHIKLKNESIFRDLKWRAVGPKFQGGRIESIACPAGYTSTIYVGVGSGNVWKTVNNGTTWEAIFEHESTFTIGDIEVSKSNPEVVWVGTGENLMARSSFAGTGVFKSIDGGKTWQDMGLHDTHHIGRVVIHPDDPDIVYVAAIGHQYSFNEERGLFKTTDGGETWDKILYTSDEVGVVDVAMDPSDNQILYASTWRANRKAWNFVGRGEECGIYKTTDGGETWKRLTDGFPVGERVGRIGLDISPSNPNVVYAIIANQRDVYRSDDKGLSWKKVNEKRVRSAFGDIKISPDDENEIYVLGTRLLHSRDGGKTFSEVSEKVVHLYHHGHTGLHLDHHDLWIDPLNADRLLLGTDGGFYISYDRSETWLHINNLPIAEFYAISADMASPYNIYGGTQDDAALFGPSTYDLEKGGEDPWKHVYIDPWGGGDSYFTLVDPTDPDTIYYEQQFGSLKRKNMKDGSTKYIKPRAKKGEPRLRCNWMTPFIISHHNPITLYYGANKLFKSINRGDSWTCISGDLTTNPGPERRGNVPYGTITSISESALKPGLIYVGTDDGNVQVTRNDGFSWAKINTGLDDKWVSRVVASQHELGTVYVCLTGYREDDFEKYLYMSTDYGKTWRSIAGNLPCESINVIREDHRDKDILYVGTDLGIYASLDRGKKWYSLCSNLPTCAVHDIAVHPRENELAIGTHGRSAFVLDVEPIQSIERETYAKKREGTDAAARMRSWRHHVKLKNESPFKSLRWSSVGPTLQGGRIEAIAVPPGNHGTIYVGPGSGNIWKTVNNGLTWEPIFENESTFTIGDIAVSSSNPDIIWVGTGETQPRHSGYSYAGTGVFKSTDAGQTWKNMGLHDTHHIGKVIIDPENPDVVYVAAIGHFWSRNEQRGLFKTTDGGKSWEKVIYISDQTGAVDLVMDPADNKTLYAAAWQLISGKESGIYKTIDAGKTWRKLTDGLPAGDLGRIGLDVSVSNPDIVYAFIDNWAPGSGRRKIVGGEVYRSSNKGETWEKANEEDLYSVFSIYGWKFCDIRISPDNENEIYILGNRGFHSRDGGKTYERFGEKIIRLHDTKGKVLHLDQHELWIDPLNPDRVILGNDGGLFMSYDRARSWLHINNLPIGEFYFVSTDMETPYNIYGGTQDNAALYGPSSYEFKDTTQDPWKHVFLDRWTGGDAFVTLRDPTDRNIVYYEHQHGDMKRMDVTGTSVLSGGEFSQNIRLWAKRGEPRRRFGWYTPFIISHHNPYTLYAGGDKLFKSLNRGQNWYAVSPDLADPGSGERGVVPFGTITMISESPFKPGLIYVGTEGGSVYLTQNDGESWVKIDKDLPDKWVSRIEASRYEMGTVYVSFTGYREDDFEKYLYMSTDYGKNWSSITGNLPSESINVVREDPKKKNILYVGTDIGVYTSLDRGVSWHSLCNNLPTTPVHDMVVHPRENELVIGTHGRSIFVLDVEPIQNFNWETYRKKRKGTDAATRMRSWRHHVKLKNESPFNMTLLRRV